MGKGNHVFNNFDGVVHNAFNRLLIAFSMGHHLAAVNNSGGNVDEAKQALNQKFPNSYRFYNEIRNHDQIKILHETPRLDQCRLNVKRPDFFRPLFN
jgi:hypothetical protein